MYLSQKGWARKSRPTKVDPRSKSLENKVSKSTHCGRDNSGKGAERINTQGKMVVRVSSKTETMFYRAGDVCNAGTVLELRTSTDGIATEPGSERERASRIKGLSQAYLTIRHLDNEV
jgi:hypothetical protein